MLEAYTLDTIKTTGLETSGHHLPDEFIIILLVLSLTSGGRVHIQYESLHKGWNLLGLSFPYATKRESKRER